jgi:hypothetical protein
MAGGDILACYGLYPYSYVSETYTPVTVSTYQIMQLKGSVCYQEGSSNKGPWVKWPRPVSPMSLPQTQFAAEPALFFAVATNDGADLGATNVIIEVSIRAWDRVPFGGVSAPDPIHPPLPSPSEDFEDVDTSDNDLRRLAYALRQLKLRDIEPNPGPTTLVFCHQKEFPS